MTEAATTILAIFAHPDDEIGAGSTLAYYAGQGICSVLVCASRGEAATIYCDECATRENLAEVRTRELECACEHLGVAQLRWLDWPDGGIRDLPRDQAVGQVVALIREIRPRIVITHPENGLYPHPDHLAIWEIARDAFLAAADPAYYPEAGPAWAAERLFTRAMPQSFFDAAPAFAAYRVELNGQQLPFIGTPDDQIDVVMHVAPWADRRMAAWDCHRSQHNPNGAFAQMPDALRRTMAENEHFVLAAERTPLPDGASGDLLAGLPPAPFLAAEVASGVPDAGVLRNELSVQQGYLAVCEGYLRNVIDPGFERTLQRYAGQEQEIIHLLARALRQAGEPPAEIAADLEAIGRGAHLETIGDRRGFLLAGVRQALARWEAYGVAAGGEEQAPWAGLAALAEAQIRILTTLPGIPS
jgi:N-acetyl-1-D-myo-inositol-2-amino-2-deoxy-alpha-D-glucopyranoside deacetylase